jgi:hypothetical protein
MNMAASSDAHAQSRKLLKDSGRSAPPGAAAHRRLQVVALGTGDAHRVALDRRLHLQLAGLEPPWIFFAGSASMPLFTDSVA